MVTLGLYVRLEAKPGKEDAVEQFLKNALQLARQETGTVAWFGIRMNETTFGIFDVFPDEKGRDAHLSGRIAAELMDKAGELLAKAPVIEKIDVLAAKLPEIKERKEAKTETKETKAETKTKVKGPKVKRAA